MTIQLPLDDDGKMLAFVDRRHPCYHQKVEHWRFCENTYEGGRGWFHANIFKYLKEGLTEFNDRVQRAYRFNHTREVTHLVTKYIFKEGVIRNVTDAPASVTRFWGNATLAGEPIDVLMKRASDKSSIAGRAWLVVDNNAKGGVSQAEQRASGAKTYAYLISQEDVLDYSFDEWGKLRWILFRIPYRDDADPIASAGKVMPRYMLWTREEWVLLEERLKPAQGMFVSSAVPQAAPIAAGVEAAVRMANNAVIGNPGDRREIVLIDRGDNTIGPEIPVFAVDHIECDDPYAPPGLVDEIAYLDRSVANYLSNLDAVIQDQTFSQLTMPAQGLAPGEEGYDKLVEMGTKRVFIYDGESGGKPEYISPDAAQAELIIKVVKMIIGEIYHSVGMAGERTKQDNAQGIDNASGVAKAYDFERMNALLCAKAAQLDRAENRLVELVCLWNGDTAPEDDLIKYPESYDVRGLPDEFEIAQNLALLEAPPSIRRQQMTVTVEKLFPRIAKAIKAKILAELKDWPKDPLEQMQEVMQLQSSITGQAPKGGIKQVTQAAMPAGGNKSGLAGPTGKGVSKQGQAGT